MSALWTIRRSTSDAKLAGVCGGVARQWGVDPVLVRVGWALLALSGGLGIVLYLAGWLLLPADGRESSPVDDMFGESVRKWPRELWIALVSIACVASFALFGWLTPFGIGPALVIALIWYFGFYRPRTGARKSTAPASPAAVSGPPPAAPFRYPGPPTPFTEAAGAWQRRIAEYQSATVPPVPPWSAPPAANLSPAYAWPPPAYAALPFVAPVPGPPPLAYPLADPEQAERAARAAFLATPDPAGLYAEPAGSSASAALVRPGERLPARRLRWAALLALGLTMAGMGLADHLGAPITPTLYATAALMVAGLTLVLATWLGRARGILPIATLLAVTVLGLSTAGSGLVAVPAGPERTLSYGSPVAFPDRGDALDVGTMRVDLSRLTLTEDATYRARVDLGTLVVTAPPEANVVVRYTLDLGSVSALDRLAATGPELSGTVADPEPMRPGRPTLTLELSADVGSVQVTR